jgi:hypothetical protein
MVYWQILIGKAAVRSAGPIRVPVGSPPWESYARMLAHILHMLR